MRASRKATAESRERIVAAASRLFRKHGFDGVGVDAVMKEAGLTHGGFYGHFASKEELAAEALAHALAQGFTKLGRHTDIGSLVTAYLSERHRQDRAEGCGLAALGAESARRGKAVRGAVSAHVAKQVAWLCGLIKGTEAGRRRRAIQTLSGLVGALMLARAVDDPDLSKEILAAARAAYAADAPS